MSSGLRPQGAPARDCVRCGGEGWTWAVYGQLDTYEPCPLCNIEPEPQGEGHKQNPAGPS